MNQKNKLVLSRSAAEKLLNQVVSLLGSLRHLIPTKRKLILFLILTLLSTPLTCRYEKRMYNPERISTEAVEICSASVLIEKEECYVITYLFFELLIVWYLLSCFIMYGVQKLSEGLHARKKEKRAGSKSS